MPARCLIVDNEAPARDELRYLLGNFEHVQVVGEATNAAEALTLLRSLTYEIVLLDIRMPGGTGLDVATALRDSQRRPKVIFTTAYPDYAVEAFDLEAVDYLVKPFDVDRLGRALDRAMSGGEAPQEPTSTTPSTAAVETPARIPVHQGDRTVLVDESDVVFACAARGYSYLQLFDERVLVSLTLSELERRVHGNFFRTHRAYLVNLDHLRELVPDFKGALTAVMDDQRRSTVEVARRQAHDLRRRLGL